MTEGQTAAPAEAATRYDFAAIEHYYGEAWERANCFAPAKGGEPFAIMMPPPNVTGTLHIGHALDNTLPDILVRRARMQGKSALYQPGTDHASIAVHVVLERQWAKEGKTRFDFSREEFMEKAWAWKDHSHGVITGQLRRLGISCDWGNERFTMDPAYSNAVNKVFVMLHGKGLIYRGMRLVNWDPKMQTAVSDLEVKHKQVNGNLWHVRYKFADGKAYKGEDGIEIATTRPETILADGAIAIHPKDKRAKDLVGRKVIVPIAGREIPIIADEMVDPEFGSGMVKITAAHDFNDFECTKRHQGEVDIPIINLMNPDATMNANCPPAYVGLDRFVARKKIVADIEELGQLIKVEPHSHNVGHAERDDTILEPYLTWQWYVKCDGIAKRCLEAADKGDVKFVNERDAKVYRHWLENIQDWCISRQLWWGHRIPAWYRDVEGQGEPEIYVGEKAPKGDGWRQDEDILDTWFSSALWPFVTQGWPEGGERVQAFYPNQAVMSGRDIMFFWLVRMMMMGLEVTDTVPFKTIFTHGLILDEKGQKMSKSKGNVVDPMELITEFGVDALRLTMASIASAEDMRYSRNKVEQSRNFCTKLWNAARFMKMQGVIWDEPARKAFKWDTVKHPVNHWLVSELKKVVAEVDTQLDAYAFNQAALAAYHFTWGIWCDWYLELCKGLLADPATAEETKLVMGWGFDQVLRILHPFVPYITEALWRQHTLEDQAFVMMQSWPEAKGWKVDEAAAASLQRVISVVSALRQARTLHRLPPKAKLQVVTQSDLTKDWMDAAGWQMVRHLANVEGPTVRSDNAKAGEAIVVVEGQELMIPLEGLIDIAAERARLEKELDKNQQEQVKIENLLGNEAFVAKAPEEVLTLNHERKAALAEQVKTLRGLLAGPYAVGK